MNTAWATYRTRSHCVIGHKSGMYNPATGQTAKWTEMVTVVDKDKDSENYLMCWGLENEERVFKDSGKESSSLSTSEQVLGEHSLILKSFKS